MDIYNILNKAIPGDDSPDAIAAPNSPVSRLFHIIGETISGYNKGGLKEAALQGGKEGTQTVVAAEILAPGATAAAVSHAKEIPAALKAAPSFTQAVVNMVKGQTLASLKSAISTAIVGVRVAKETLESESSVMTASAKLWGKAKTAIAANATEATSLTEKLATGADFAGKMALANSAIGVISDRFDYSTGKKEKSVDNIAGTVTDAVTNLDPFKALSSTVSWLTFGKVKVDVSIDKAMNVALGKVGLTDGKYESIAQKRQQIMAIYDQESRRFQPGMTDPAHRHGDPHEPAKPLMTDYQHLAAMNLQLKKYLPDGKIDGKDVVAEFHQIDMTDPKNYRKYKSAIDKAMIEQQQIMAESSSLWPRWMRRSDAADKYNMAESQLNLLSATEKEWQDYDKRIRESTKESDKPLHSLAPHALAAAQQQRTETIQIAANLNPAVTVLPTPAAKPGKQAHDQTVTG